MKDNRPILIAIVLILMVTLGFVYNNYSNSFPEKRIASFLNEKSDLYRKREEVINALDATNKNESMLIAKELDEVLKGMKKLLTEREYGRLIMNRYLLDQDLLKRKYDKSEITDIKYEKLSEDEKIVTYIVEYTENLYTEKELKEKKDYTNEFTLEQVNNKWIISHID